MSTTEAVCQCPQSGFCASVTKEVRNDPRLANDTGPSQPEGKVAFALHLVQDSTAALRSAAHGRRARSRVPGEGVKFQTKAPGLPDDDLACHTVGSLISVLGLPNSVRPWMTAHRWGNPPGLLDFGAPLVLQVDRIGN